MDFTFLLKFLIAVPKIAIVVLIFSILVIAHEFGHFILAKASGMRVDEFAIGFGKRLFAWKRGETLYTVNLIPIGGYNKIYGMDVEEELPDSGDGEQGKDKAVSTDEEITDTDEATEKKGPLYQPPDYSVAPKDDPRAFVNRPLYQRFGVIVAGPVANILVAILVVFLMGISIGFPAAEIGDVIPGGPASDAGLLPGDIITHMDGVRLSSTADLQRTIAYSGSQPIELRGWRGEETFDLTVIPQPIRLVDSWLSRVGFTYLADGSVLSVIPDTPAQSTGLQPGDLILEVNGIRFPSQDLNVDDQGGSLGLRIFRDYEFIDLEISYTASEIVTDQYSYFGYLVNADQVVTWVLTSGIAAEAGLEIGDRIVGGVVETYVDTYEGENTGGPKPTTLEYERDGRIRSARLKPDPLFSRIEVFMDNATLPVLSNLPFDHPLALAGLQNGDEITSVNGVPTPNGITAFLELEKVLTDTSDIVPFSEVDTNAFLSLAERELDSNDISGLMERNAQLIAFAHMLIENGKKLTIVALSDEGEKIVTLPILTEYSMDELLDFFNGIHYKTRYYSTDPVSSMVAGVRKSQEISQFIFMAIGMLINGDASISDLAGPVGIVNITYQAATNGLVDLINIMVLLSVNLAIFNLLPFPALDGGRILFMIPELFLRRPVVTVRIENMIHILGFLLLIIFALFVTYHDIARLFAG